MRGLLLLLLLALPAQAATVLEAGGAGAAGARSTGPSWSVVGTLGQLQPVGVAVNLHTVEGGLWHLPELDNDGDGWADADDCDAFDASVYPFAPEIADDGFDQDCNGFDAVTCWTDSDGDGFGAEPMQLGEDALCDDVGQTADDTDCDDTDAAISPSGVESCDAIDSDCDGDLVEGDPDLDGDGVPDCVDVDSDGDGFDIDDCDDGDASVNPSATEIWDDGIDQDCNGFDTVTCYVDDDGDGDGSSSVRPGDDGLCDDVGQAATNTDCDDTDIDIYAGAPEVPEDGIDQDCNGFDSVLCFEDGDDDGFGVTTQVFAAEGDCAAAGHATVDTDCDDTDATIFPGATELTGDGIDQDCSGADIVACYDDGDGDGFGGDLELTEGDCSDPDLSTVGGDCEDDDAAVFPGAPEVCNFGIDDDCDPTTDEDADSDGDGISICEGDCDDDNEAVYPGALEACDGLDTDCFAFTEDDEADVDADGHRVCDGDCDDSDDTIYPDAPELCDDLDNDCDGEPEDPDDLDFFDWYLDADGDGFGDPTSPHADSPSCASLDGAVTNSLDCDDGDPLIHPDRDEVCDGIDNDCDPSTDRDGGDRDADQDGFLGCEGDCRDDDPDIHPDAVELCEDAIDSDCDGREATPEGEPECWEGACDCEANVGGARALPLLLLFGWRRRQRQPMPARTTPE